MIRKFSLIVALSFAALCAGPALSQPGGAVQSIAPMTRDLGALITLAARATGTVNSADQNGFNVSRIICLYNQTTTTLLSSATITLQNKDAASGAYYTLLTTAAIASPVQAFPFGAGIGMTNTTTAANLPIARTWRIQLIAGGTTASTITGTVGCSVQ